MAKSHLPAVIAELERKRAQIDLALNLFRELQRDGLFGTASERRNKLLGELVGMRAGREDDDEPKPKRGRPPKFAGGPKGGYDAEGRPLNARGQPYERGPYKKREPSAAQTAARQANAKKARAARKRKAAERRATTQAPAARAARTPKRRKERAGQYELWCQNSQCINHHAENQPGATKFTGAKNSKWCTRDCYNDWYNRTRRGRYNKQNGSGEAAESGEARATTPSRRSAHWITCKVCAKEKLVSGAKPTTCYDCKRELLTANAKKARKALAKIKAKAKATRRKK